MAPVPTATGSTASAARHQQVGRRVADQDGPGGLHPQAAQKAWTMPGAGFAPKPASAPATKSSRWSMPSNATCSDATAVSSMVATPMRRPRARSRASNEGRSPTGGAGTAWCRRSPAVRSRGCQGCQRSRASSPQVGYRRVRLPQQHAVGGEAVGRGIVAQPRQQAVASPSSPPSRCASSSAAPRNSGTQVARKLDQGSVLVEQYRLP